MSTPPYLTKLKFKLANECPAKLYYSGKPNTPTGKLDDAFLAALPDGGFQVGELAKLYFPRGHTSPIDDPDEVIAETNRLLASSDTVTLSETAFRYENLFVRADIVVKDGDRIELFEVKAKSFDGADSAAFRGRGGAITSVWKPYLEDVAFQKYVIQKANPDYTVRVHLMMADKNSLSPPTGSTRNSESPKTRTGGGE